MSTFEQDHESREVAQNGPNQISAEVRGTRFGIGRTLAYCGAAAVAALTVVTPKTAHAQCPPGYGGVCYSPADIAAIQGHLSYYEGVPGSDNPIIAYGTLYQPPVSPAMPSYGSAYDVLDAQNQAQYGSAYGPYPAPTTYVQYLPDPNPVEKAPPHPVRTSAFWMGPPAESEAVKAAWRNRNAPPESPYGSAYGVPITRPMVLNNQGQFTEPTYLQKVFRGTLSPSTVYVRDVY